MLFHILNLNCSFRFAISETIILQFYISTMIEIKCRVTAPGNLFFLFNSTEFSEKIIPFTLFAKSSPRVQYVQKDCS